MRIERSVTSLSWIPSEAVTGLSRGVFDAGFGHYDDPPPDVIDDLAAMRDADRFRFANHLAVWIEVDGNRIVDAGYSGGCVMGSTTLSMGSKQATFAAVAFDDLQSAPVIEGTSARFVQTVGGHTAVPAPRRVNRPPFVQLAAPAVWTTLALTVHTDGRTEFELVGASTFPRHWVYDQDGRLAAKAGLSDFKDWYRRSFGKHTPWGDTDSPAYVTTVESALERELATHIMRSGEKPAVRKVAVGKVLTEQGHTSDVVYLLLNGVLQVEVDGEAIAEVGPGAILGERAALETGTRTSTLRALTKVTVAVSRADQIDRAALVRLSADHRRETITSGV
jgi:hypothetical protein